MQQLTKDLRHQLNEQPSKIENRKKLVEKSIELQLQKTQKETSQAEKLLEDQLEVGPTVQSGLIPPTTSFASMSQIVSWSKMSKQDIFCQTFKVTKLHLVRDS